MKTNCIKKDFCDNIDTSGMTELKSCKDCPDYDDGVKETGGIYCFEIIKSLKEFIKRLKLRFNE